MLLNNIVRKRGRPRKIVDTSTESKQIIDGKDLTYSTLSDTIQKPTDGNAPNHHQTNTNANASASKTVFDGRSSVSVEPAGRVGDPREPSVDNSKDSSPLSDARNKKGLEWVVSGYKFPEANFCACWHCRTFESRVKWAMRQILEKGV